MSYGLGDVCNSLAVNRQTGMITDNDAYALYRTRDNWMPRRRKGISSRNYQFFELWYQSGFSPDLTYIGMSWNDLDEYEDQEPMDSGKRGTYWLKGQTLDSGGSPVGGVVVNGFRTSDNLFVGTSTSDSDGNYMVPTPFSSGNHFVVAYLDIATDQFGTTANFLTPTAS